jgi:hypothetical protein
MSAVDEEGEHPAPRKRRVDIAIAAVTLLIDSFLYDKTLQNKQKRGADHKPSSLLKSQETQVAV